MKVRHVSIDMELDGDMVHFSVLGSLAVPVGKKDENLEPITEMDGQATFSLRLSTEDELKDAVIKLLKQLNFEVVVP